MNSHEVLLNAIVSVFENTAFLSATELISTNYGEEFFKSSDKMFTICIQSVSNMLVLRVCHDLACLAASNMLSRDLNDSEILTQSQDAVLEITNIIAGLIFNSSSTPSEGEITLPRIIEFGEIKQIVNASDLVPIEFVSLMMENYPLSAILYGEVYLR